MTHERTLDEFETTELLGRPNATKYRLARVKGTVEMPHAPHHGAITNKVAWGSPETAGRLGPSDTGGGTRNVGARNP